MQTLLLVGLTATAWSFLHSYFITHRWQKVQKRLWPRLEPYSRLIYVVANTLSLGLLLIWWWGLPARLLWTWDGPWAGVRWVGLAAAGAFFLLGARAYDNRAFLGFRQVQDHRAGRRPADPAFTTKGILTRIRHPWYTGTLLFFVFCLPVTDVNLVWRGVFLLYTLMGTELEERKLLKELGTAYGDYRKTVGRFFPRF